MKTFELPLPLLGAVAGTRAMLGAGIGLLVSERLTHRERRAIGWTLVAIGAATTIPLALTVFSHRRSGT
jgi:hypothetical protein